MPKDNEVDEKVMPVAWIVTNGGETCEPWLEYEQSEVDALPAVCIAEPLYSAATVAELRAEAERLRGILIATTNPDGSPNLLATQVGAAETYRLAAINANRRADAAERRVGECLKLADVLGVIVQSPDVTIPQWHRIAGIADEFRATLTGADPT